MAGRSHAVIGGEDRVSDTAGKATADTRKHAPMHINTHLSVDNRRVPTARRHKSLNVEWAGGREEEEKKNKNVAIMSF